MILWTMNIVYYQLPVESFLFDRQPMRLVCDCDCEEVTVGTSVLLTVIKGAPADIVVVAAGSEDTARTAVALKEDALPLPLPLLTLLLLEEGPLLLSNAVVNTRPLTALITVTRGALGSVTAAALILLVAMRERDPTLPLLCDDDDCVACTASTTAACGGEGEALVSPCVPRLLFRVGEDSGAGEDGGVR